MKTHNTSTINSSARYCLAKPGDKVRITKTHWAGIRQYLACEGDTFVITKVTDDQIPYGRWLQPSGVLAASELKGLALESCLWLHCTLKLVSSL